MSETKTKFSANTLAIAGLITALGGFIVILNQTFFTNKNKPKEPKEIIINNNKQKKDVDEKTKLIEPKNDDLEKVEPIYVSNNKEDVVPVIHRNEISPVKKDIPVYNLTGNGLLINANAHDNFTGIKMQLTMHKE